MSEASGQPLLWDGVEEYRAHIATILASLQAAGIDTTPREGESSAERAVRCVGEAVKSDVTSLRMVRERVGER